MWYMQYEVEIANMQVQQLKATVQQQDKALKQQLQKEERNREHEVLKERSEIDHMQAVFTRRLLFVGFMWIISSTLAFYYYKQVTNSYS